MYAIHTICMLYSKWLSVHNHRNHIVLPEKVTGITSLVLCTHWCGIHKLKYVIWTHALFCILFPLSFTEVPEVSANETKLVLLRFLRCPQMRQQFTNGSLLFICDWFAGFRFKATQLLLPTSSGGTSVDAWSPILSIPRHLSLCWALIKKRDICEGLWGWSTEMVLVNIRHGTSPRIHGIPRSPQKVIYIYIYI